MSKEFSINVSEWLEPGSGDLAERSTNAEICIEIGENCATQVEDFASRTVRSVIRVSAEPLAKWLLQNWWRLLNEAEPFAGKESPEWMMAHALATAGSGYIWPNLIFRGTDGAQINVVCKRHHAANEENRATVRFLNSFQTQISREAFGSGCRDFTEKVLARLSDCGIKKSELHELWNDLRTEWGNSYYKKYRVIESSMGLEPDERDDLVNSVLTWSAKYGFEAVEEIVAEFGHSNIEATLNTASRFTARVRTYADASDVISLAADADLLSDRQEAWQQAQSVAYALRDKWQLGDEPISDRKLADRLNISEKKLTEARRELPFSFGVRGTSSGKLGFAISRTLPQYRRFDISRLLGDYIAFEYNERILPSLDTFTRRQKFQRAFAAEFLCPSEVIKDEIKRFDSRSIGEQIESISTRYDVSQQVVIHHLENRGVLPHGLTRTAPLFFN